MSIYNDDIARPYVYLITFDTGEYYYGYREANIVPARFDIGFKYFTSSEKIKAMGLDHATIEIINEFEGSNPGDDAWDSEQGLIWHFWDDPLLLNGTVTRPTGSHKRWKAKKGKDTYNSGKTYEELYGTILGKQKRENHSLKLQGKPSGMLGKSHSYDTKYIMHLAQLAENNHLANKTIYIWFHPKFGEEECSTFDLIRRYPGENLNRKELCRVARKNRKSHRCWSLK